MFYDHSGRLISQLDSGHSNLILQDAGSAMPVIWPSSPQSWEIYSPAGRQLLSIPTSEPATDFKTIGTKEYVRALGTSLEEERWQQWDLQTGIAGSTCHLEMHGYYIGSDGNVVILNPRSQGVQAVDMSTCRTLWEIPPQQGLSVWQVGTGLIQRTGDEIIALVPPD